jgi:hypothetical protein
MIQSRRLFFPALILLLVDRLVILIQFGFKYTGNDDSLFWIAAKDYAQGIFHEPFIYGQDYGYMLESFLAVPGVWFGIKPEYVFPIVTSLLAIAPFITFASWFRRNEKHAGALVMLLIPVLLSPAYAIETTITRGFVIGTGALALWPVFARLKSIRVKWFLQGFILLAAILLNPNSILAVFPVFIFSAAANVKNMRFWIFHLAGAIPVFTANYFAQHFYVTHPQNILHKLPDDSLEFHWNNFTKAVSQLHLHLDGLCPLWWKNGTPILLLFLIPLFYFVLKKQSAHFLALAITILLFFFSLGLNKIHDGSVSVFFSWSRMFLALPLTLAFFLALAIPEKISPRFLVLLEAGGIGFIILKGISLPDIAEFQSANRFKLLSPVEELPVHRVKTDAGKLYAYAKNANADLVVALEYDGYSMQQLWFNAGSVWYEDFPSTLIPAYERRTWRLQEEDTIVQKTILFLGGNEGWWEERMKENNRIKMLDHFSDTGFSPKMYLLEENDVALIPLLKEWGYAVRKH